MSTGIILFNNNFPQTKILDKIFCLNFNTIGFFYSCSYTLEKKVYLLDLYSKSLPGLSKSFVYSDIFKADFISSIDTCYIDHPKFRLLLLDFFKDEIVFTKEDFKKVNKTNSLPGLIIFDLFLSKLGLIFSNLDFNRTYFESKEYLCPNLGNICSEIISNLSFSKNKEYLDDLLLAEKYKNMIQDILDEKIDLDMLALEGFKIKNKDIIIKRNELSNWLIDPEINLRNIFSKLNSDISNNKPVFIDYDFLIDNINRISNLNLKSFGDFSVMVGLFSKKTQFINFKKNDSFFIIPSRNYNLETLNIDELKTLIEVCDNEMKISITSQIQKMKNLEI